MSTPDCPIEPHSRRSIIGTRIVEAIIIAAVTAGATGYVSLRVVEARADNDRESISELKVAMRENTRAINDLTRLANRLETVAEERRSQIEARLRALEERRR